MKTEEKLRLLNLVREANMEGLRKMASEIATDFGVWYHVTVADKNYLARITNIYTLTSDLWYLEGSDRGTEAHGMFTELVRPATEEEVERRLMKDAETRYKANQSSGEVELVGYLDTGMGILKGTEFIYNSEEDTLSATGGCMDVVYRDGVWAKPITEVTLTAEEYIKLNGENLGHYEII